MPRWSHYLSIAYCALWVAATALGASPTEQRRELSRVATSLRVAERMAKANRNDEAVAAFTEAQAALNKVANGLSDRLERTFNRASDQLAKTHATLTNAGIKLPPLEKISPTSLGATTSDSWEGGVSFVDHIVPLLSAKCGGCHVQDNKGNVSFASYNHIIEGVPSGRYIEVGSGMESVLVDVIASGQMPPERTGQRVTPAETRMLLTWINQGAKFDGDDPDKPLSELNKVAMASRASDDAEIETTESRPIPQPKGNETVSFAVDVAPLLVESCRDCHSADRPRAGFSIANFEQLWAGGNSGSAIEIGRADDSLLVQKLHGTAASGARMPQNRPAWSDEKIALVETWIAEGAKFDGVSTTEPLARVVALAKAGRMTPEQLSAEREQQAASTWRLAIPDESASSAVSDHFYVVGNLPDSRLESLAATAENQAARVLDFFKQADEPLDKGRITIYAFDSRIDYSEFGTMVERRSLAQKVRGHVQFDIVHPYIALVAEDESQETLDRSVATYVASLHVAGQAKGRLPNWFATGAGMAVAARLHGKDAEIRRWRDELPTALASLNEPNDFMAGKLPPRSGDLLAFGFVDALLRKPANFGRLVTAVAESDDFDAACQKVFGKSAKDVAALWVASQRRR